MARPKQDSPEPSARERLIGAFWKMLARMPFDDITIGGISREAKVSQNTLYYHFDGLLGIAQEALQAELSEETARKMISGAPDDLSSLFLAGSRDRLRLSRIGLAASSGSARLTSMLINMLKAAWCDLSGRSPETLTQAESTDLDFIYGGLVSVLSGQAIQGEARYLADFLERPLGRGIATTMANLSSERPS